MPEEDLEDSVVLVVEDASEEDDEADEDLGAVTVTVVVPAGSTFVARFFMFMPLLPKISVPCKMVGMGQEG